MIKEVRHVFSEQDFQVIRDPEFIEVHFGTCGPSNIALCPLWIYCPKMDVLGVLYYLRLVLLPLSLSLSLLLKCRQLYRPSISKPALARMRLAFRTLVRLDCTNDVCSLSLKKNQGKAD